MTSSRFDSGSTSKTLNLSLLRFRSENLDFKLDVEGLNQVKCNTVKECSDPRYCYCHQDLKLCFCDPPAKQDFVAKVINNRLVGQNENLLH